MIKSNTYDFLLQFEKSFDDISNIDLFKLFFGTRPSIFFTEIFADKELNFQEFKQFIMNIRNIFVQTHHSFNHLATSRCFHVENDLRIITSNQYWHHIRLKWIIEVQKNFMLNRFEKFNHMLIYSINTNDVLIKEITNMIQNLTDAILNEEIKLQGFDKCASKPDFIDLRLISFYKFELINKKRYTVKISNLENINGLPAGLATAYLNGKNGFISLGYVGINRSLEYVFSYIFFSIEEEPNFYLSETDSFDIFKSNVVQTFYFVLYILDLHNSLSMHITELKYKNDGIIFAVDNSDNEKWKFRLENVGFFICHKHKGLYYNHSHLIYFIDMFLTFFDDKDLLNFFENLKDAADKLKDSNDKDYFVVLTNMVEYELNVFKDDLE